jgi:protein-disulfide isomerase
MSKLAEPVSHADHVLGAPHAAVTLVEYLDYECPFCGRANREVNIALRRIGQHVRYVARHFPLTQVHPRAQLAAMAAEAAGAQRAFWPMHFLLFENQEALELEDLVLYADTLGLDVSLFTRTIRAGLLVAKIQADFRLGVRSGVNGTPTFFLDGYRYDYSWDADSLTRAIEDTLRRSYGHPVSMQR